MTCFSKIIGTGGYLPEKVMTNDDISKLVDTSDDWIYSRTGIKRRHIAADNETAASMAEIASGQAIEAAGIDSQSIDLIILATSTPERVFPSSACLLQQRLGISQCPAFDIQAACSGFVFGLSIADQYIKSGLMKRVLVVGTEVFSRIVDWSDRTTCVLFGDGAGAALLEASDEPGILSTHVHSDGRYQDLLYLNNDIQHGGLNNVIDTEAAFVKMEGNEVFKVAVKTLGRIVDETLSANAMKQEDIDWLVPHQANIRIISATAKKLAMPMGRVVTTLEDQGNTSAASIPLALNEAIRDERIKRGQVLLLEAFGAGFTWGSALLRY